MSILSGLIGSFGPVVFTVSENYINTFYELQTTFAAKYAEHDVAGQKSVSEFLGEELDQITFKMQLTTSKGLSPLISIEILNQIKKNGVAFRLIVGLFSFGKFTIREFSTNWLHVSNNGFPLVVEVEISLTEYVDTVKSQALTATSTDESMKSETGKGGPFRLPGADAAMKFRSLIPI